MNSLNFILSLPIFRIQVPLHFPLISHRRYAYTTLFLGLDQPIAVSRLRKSLMQDIRISIADVYSLLPHIHLL